jgi:hypothetical protein
VSPVPEAGPCAASEEPPRPGPEVATPLMTRQDSGHRWTNRR